MPADMLTNAPTLTDLAAEINAALRQADSTRLHAGRLLLQAREIFEAGKAQGDTWRAWCTTNIPNRSYRDIKRVMALARSADPAAALTKEREKARLGVAEKRAREVEGTNVSPPQTVRLGKQAVDVSGWGDAAKAQVMAALAAPDTDNDGPEGKKRYWLMPPKLREQIEGKYGDPSDVCPHPRPRDFDALSPDFRWPENALCHPLFVLADL